MAFALFNARKLAWKQKTQLIPKGKLKISDAAMATFAIIKPRLWSTSITSLIQRRYGLLPISRLPELINQINPPFPNPDLSITAEAAQLMTSIAAINIKKTFSENAERIEVENDLLMCIEVFSSLLNTTPPSPQVESALNQQILWDQIDCSIFGIEFTNDNQVKQFRALSKNAGLRVDHDLVKTPTDTSENFRDFNRSFQKTKVTPELFTACIFYSVLTCANDVSNCYGGLLFLLSFSVSRVSNFRSQGWVKRYNAIQQELLKDNQLLTSLSETSARDLSLLIDTKVKDGLDPSNIAHEISRWVSKSYNHVPQLVALAGQTTYKGLTGLQMIARAISERSDVPWVGLFERYPVLASEFEVAKQFLDSLEDDTFAGVKYGGISQEIKNLLYLSVRSLIILGGEESLKSYAGFGGEGTQLTVPMKTTLDLIITKIKEEQAKQVIFLPGDEVDSGLATSYQSKFKKFSRFLKLDSTKPPGDDDDDDDDSRPGPSAPYIPFQGDEVDEPEPTPLDPAPDDLQGSMTSKAGSKRAASVDTTGTPRKGRRTLRSTAAAPDVQESTPTTSGIDFTGLQKIYQTYSQQPLTERQRTLYKNTMSFKFGDDEQLTWLETKESSAIYESLTRDYIYTQSQTGTMINIKITSLRKSSATAEATLDPSALIEVIYRIPALQGLPYHVVIKVLLVYLYVLGRSSEGEWKFPFDTQLITSETQDFLNDHMKLSVDFVAMMTVIHNLCSVAKSPPSFIIELK